MSGLFGTLYTANKGLMASQTSLHTVGHNLANANTRGYSRQRVEQKADMAFNFVGVGQLGTGVRMTGIHRVVDNFTVKHIRQENSIYNKYGAKSDILGQIETIFNEPSDVGVNFNLGEMFDAWQELSKNPESLTAKNIVVEKSKTLAETLNHMSRQLNGLKDSTKELIGQNVLEFNSIVDKLEALNKQIFSVEVKGQVPNDLLDERDLLLADLSSIANIDASFDKFGRVEVSVKDEAGGKIVVLGKDAAGNDVKETMFVDDDGKTISIGEADPDDPTKPIDPNNVVKIEVESGQIAGNIEALEEIEGRIKDLNEFAGMMADEINKVHTLDKDGNPIADIENIFVSPDGTDITAGNIKVNDEIIEDPSKIIAGAKKDGPDGDGSRALAMAGLRNKKIGEVGGKGGTTIEGAYSNITIKVGISKEYADNMVDNQEVLLDHLELRRESTSGVSINEEVTNMIKFQSAFDANSRVITVLADMLDTLINRTGV